MPFAPGRARLIPAVMGHAASIAYLLRDDFTDALAAGSVNGTAATPGPGTRVVADTGNKLSISGGALVFTAGNLGDPGIWYSAITRTPGLMLFAHINRSAVVNTHYLGTDQNQTTSPNGSNFALAASAVFLYDNGSATESVFAMSLTTDYIFLIVHLSAGARHFVKGGAFTKWTYLGETKTNNTSTLYPCIIGQNNAFTSNFIRVPSILWIPTALAYDTFTRTDGALGSTETTGPDGAAAPAVAIPALPWSNSIGTSEILTNRIITTALDAGTSSAAATVTTPTADIHASISMTRGTSTAGLVFRYKDALNYGYAVHDGTNAELHKVVAGVDTALVDTAATYAAGGVIRAVCFGTKWRLYYNNALVGTEQTVSDADLLSGKGVGWYATDIDSVGDAFTVYARGTEGQYSYLDTFTV